MLATSSFAQCHSVDVIHWSALVISSPSRSRIIFLSFFRSHCVIFFELSPSSEVFCCLDQCFVDLAATLGQVFLSLLQQVWGTRWCHLPISSLVFQSLCRSCISTWIRGSILQRSPTISHSVMLQFSSLVSISLIVSLVPTLNLRISHLF